MRSTRRFVLAAGFLALGAIPFGILTRGGQLGVPATDRVDLRGARAAVYQEIERLENVVPAGRHREDGLWRQHLDVVDREVAQGHIDAAVRAWHDAYSVALESRSWESMVAAGDAFLAIGRASGSVRGARMNARAAYLTALIRARREHSVDGVLRIAEAFRQLDERAVFDHCVHIAAQLAEGNEQAQQSVSEARQRWAARQAETETEF